MEHELIFEIGTEEIPAGFIPNALRDLKKLLQTSIADQQLPFSTVTVAGTPRRLAARVSGLADRQPDSREECIGPPRKAAFDADGNPTKAAMGFARSKGVALEDLQVVTTAKGEYLMAVVETSGRPTTDILNELLPQVITAIPFAKSMRWGSGTISFARPILWVAALYGGQPLSFAIDTVAAGATSRGHRFMAPETFTITGWQQYLDETRRRHVLVDPQERRQEVKRQVDQAAQALGGLAIADPDLVETVADLVEKPHAVCGTFEERFLVLPREVLITSMREHQKYFAVANQEGDLLPHFIAINNTAVRDSKLAAQGHQRVLRARLEDALFFFKEDQNKTPADRIADLDGIIFQRKLGTMGEKCRRLVELAGWLARRLAPEEETVVRRAALLAKTDLLTDMVGEFPSLQGIMGREYALLAGEEAAVGQAIHQHYMPIRAGEALPPSMAGALLSMADRMDTITGCFGIGEIPSGTADPFGLRRLTLGLLHIIDNRRLRLSLSAFIDQALTLYGDKLTQQRETTKEQVLTFIKGRFINDLTAKGCAAATVEAAVASGFDDCVDCKMRHDALEAISGREEFGPLAAAFKRVRNIIKDNRQTTVDRALLREPAEQQLHKVLLQVQQEIGPLLAAADYQEALLRILTMKDPIDRFFDDVMVMADDPAVRQNRLALLTAIADLFLRIGDFSRMYTLA